MFTVDGQESPWSSVTTSTRSLSLNLKNHYNSDQPITSTPAGMFRNTPLQMDGAESYLNLFNLENGTKPTGVQNGGGDALIRPANGRAGSKGSSEVTSNEVVRFESRNSGALDER